MAGISDLRADTDWTELFDEHKCQWACWGCSQPTTVIYRAQGSRLPNVFECPHNRFAPHAGSERCPHFDPIPGYNELWE